MSGLSLRQWGKGAAAVLAIALAAGAWWRYGGQPSLDALRGHGDPQQLARLPEASMSIAYVTDAKQWLTFPLTRGSAQLKLVANANLRNGQALAAQSPPGAPKRWRYALDIQVLSGSGEVLLQRSHHLRADLARYVDVRGERFSPVFYLRSDLSPLGGNIVMLDLTALPSASQLRVKLAEQDADVHDVVVRAFEPQRISTERADVLWQRLSERQRQALARGSVYPHELLSGREHRELLMNTWQALGPQGAKGRDYLPRDLYTLNDYEANFDEDPPPPQGLLADAWHHANITLPSEGGQFRLEIKPTGRALPPAWSRPAHQGVRARWYGSSSAEQRTLSWPWRANGIEARQQLPGGLLEFSVPEEATIRLWWQRAGGQEQEITPQPVVLRAHLAGSGTPVVYRFAEVSTERTALRLDLRTAALPDQPRPTSAHYRFKSAEGRVLAEGDVALTMLPSPHARGAQDHSGVLISEPKRLYFDVPPTAQTLEVEGATPSGALLLVTAYTRPQGLAREMQVPEPVLSDEAVAAAEAAASGPVDAPALRMPAWFALPPQNELARILNHQTWLLALQATPPAPTSSPLASGAYQWQDFRPQEAGWLSRNVYAPREPQQPWRDDALPTTFSPLAMQRSQTLEFRAPTADDVVQPSLLWVGADGPAHLDVQIGAQRMAFDVHGPTQQIALGAVPIGPQAVRVHSTQRGQVYINHVRPRGAALIKRVAQQLSGSRSFAYERTAAVAETLTLRYFQPAGRTQGAALGVKVKGPATPELTPQSQWVFSERLAHLSPAGNAATAVFDAGGARSDSGQAIHLPFAADAPLGRWTITVTAPPQAAGLLTMTRLSPILRPVRTLQLQTATLDETH